MTRESVAQAFYISPNYLSHLFQKNGAIGFNEYLNHTRLEHAKTLLKGYDLKVKEVAHRCGFVDSNYFCRLFRKKYGTFAVGVSPPVSQPANGKIIHTPVKRIQ